ncbi:DUF378 domain-containing protein [Alicyclobacillus sp. SO9]|uniref:DUF378 domain-containing protein n=1 Tax=Alicyclobacillus sp. SO9 TaxID=2665646 RepID=UPI0018E7166C|nr:DUF378 domain-containing protein [Alicyclobacillus sp. SO9]QQE77780.1 DUF378 domain-containing protein [Alicyclobacillus sp. SO9]
MVEKVAWWLVLIGALNWLLVGLIDVNVVGVIFGGDSTLWSRVVYVIVGLAGVYLLPQAFGIKMVGKKS